MSMISDDSAFPFVLSDEALSGMETKQPVDRREWMEKNTRCWLRDRIKMLCPFFCMSWSSWHRIPKAAKKLPAQRQDKTTSAWGSVV